jgi:hypothetical protein
MKLNRYIVNPSLRSTIFPVGFLFLLLNTFITNAQTVSRVQNLSFGNFIPFGVGGTVSVSPTYVISRTGDIILKSNPSPASFDLYVVAGKTVQMTYNKDVTLVGDHGGTIALVLNDSSPTGNGTLVTGTSPTRIFFGGTLTVGSPAITPVGTYNGSFQVNFTVINP